MLGAFSDVLGQNNQTKNEDDEDMPYTDYYQLRVDAGVYSCDIFGGSKGSEVFGVPERAVFTKIGETADAIIVRFWKWSESSTESKTFNSKPNEKRKYFLLSKTDFEGKAMKYYSNSIKRLTFTIGAVVIPIKLRMQPFDFSKDVTLGTMAGARWRLSHRNPHFFNLVGGFGLTSVTLDSASTDGKVRQSSDRASFTLSVAGLFEFKKAQVGVFIGWDWITAKEPAWRYQGKTWISVGIGYALYKRNKESNGALTEKQ